LCCGGSVPSIAKKISGNQAAAAVIQSQILL
jgi:hypothetical protein